MTEFVAPTSPLLAAALDQMRLAGSARRLPSDGLLPWKNPDERCWDLIFQMRNDGYRFIGPAYAANFARVNEIPLRGGHCTCAGCDAFWLPLPFDPGAELAT